MCQPILTISEYGIFSIEIKNWGLNSHINEKGYLINKNGKSVNVIEQSMRHVHNLFNNVTIFGKEV